MPANGYAWWYLDGISADGGRAISIIAFIGSVFSPWYAWSGRRAPENHVCLNVATYGPGGRFAMTDRGRAALRQSADRLRIGPSEMRWQGDRLVVEIDEVGAPPRLGRLRGRVILRPAALTGVELPLTPQGSHVWRPFAPVAAIAVDLEAPGWQWHGHGYFDANFGTRALEQDFAEWSWGRFPTPDATGDGCTCLYEVRRRDGSAAALGVRFDERGGHRPVDLPPDADLPRSFWRLRRRLPADPGCAPQDHRMLLDAPFYCRAAVGTVLGGIPTVGVHEVLDLRRFRQPWLKPMLAVRVPRRAGWRAD